LITQIKGSADARKWRIIDKMRDANCIFCKIIGGEIPSNTIYEDDEFKVILAVRSVTVTFQRIIT
jgi:histidine triad (HIT) family protein